MASYYGTTGNDTLSGGAGNDTIYGGAGQDTALYAGNSQDYRVFALADGSYGAIHTANISYNGSRVDALLSDPDTILSTFDSTGPDGFDRLIGVETIAFANGTFVLSGYAQALGSFIHVPGTDYSSWYDQTAFTDSPVATDGNDSLTGSSGYDLILTGTGNDTVQGGAGDDVIAGVRQRWHYAALGATVIDTDGNDGDGYAVVGGDRLLGGAGNDDIYAGYGTLVDGGSGIDTVHLDLTTAWEPWTAHTILTWFNALGVNVDLRQAATGSIDLAVGGLGNLVTTLTGIERFDIQFGRGSDSVIGGTFDDILRGGDGNDAISGVDGNDQLFGQEGADALNGGAGNDTLEGAAGDDTIDGGTGQDVARFLFLNSTKIEAIAGGYRVTDSGWGNGSDQIFNVEVLRFVERDIVIGSVIDGTNSANIITPSKSPTGQPLVTILDDVIYGYGGNDSLDGGLGADVMYGGAGNDTYVIDNSGDTVSEESTPGVDDGGSDTVKATVSYRLSTHIEKLILTGTGDISGDGNDLANALTGNAGNNALDGGAGNDTLLGGAGNDHLVGGTGDDKLDGGTGADAMLGGSGNDTYYVDDSGDFVAENANEGTDIVNASVSYSLTANVEKLTLTGTGNISGTGNELANTLLGNTGHNLLYGLAGKDSLTGGGGNDTLVGGSGADVLTGGAGADYFRFDVLETALSKDTVKDFVHGTDKIEIDHSAFAAFASDPLGGLSALELGFGTKATTASQHLIYNAVNGALYYDDDGNGAHAQVQIAVLSTKPVLDAGDFLLV